MIRGYEVDKEKYVPVTDEELERLAPERAATSTCGDSSICSLFLRCILTVRIFWFRLKVLKKPTSC